MDLLALPSGILLAIFTYANLSWATMTTPAATQVNGTQSNTTLATNGTGSEYASACYSAQRSYWSAYTSWNSAHAWVSTTIETAGSTSLDEVTYYENATTLCDGHARVTYSPAISLSTGTVTQTGFHPTTSTVLGTYFSAYPSSSPSCSINPDDCDGLWDSYSSSVEAAGSLITATPIPTPPCLNQSAASSWASATESIYGCGKCTIFGNGVELVYFPTTVSSRDMCAMTPTANLTHYGPSAVITAYAGKSNQEGGVAQDKQTAVVDGHTFTSGTAYVSISTVYAVDRCSKTFGTPVLDAVLAMPSESVLSLRYSQDHFQRLMETDKITGYPVSYADFNTPIPWSAWNGQNICDPGGYGGWACSIIYENQFRPQLAIPPQITDLSPDFKDCQMWYNGLWDPPLALQPAKSADSITLPSAYAAESTTAAPLSTPMSPTAYATALPETAPGTATGAPNTPHSPASVNVPPENSPSQSRTPSPGAGASPTSYAPAAQPWIHSFEVGGHTYWATGANDQVKVDGTTVFSGAPSVTLNSGVQASYGSDGLMLQGTSTVKFDVPTSSQQSGTVPGNGGAGVTPAAARPSGQAGPVTATVSIGGHVETVVQSSDGGPIAIGSSTTLMPGGPATTLPNGQVLSAASDSLIIGWSSTLVGSAETSSTENAGPSSIVTSSTGHPTRSSQSTSATAAQATSQTSTQGSAQGSASPRMSPSQALSLFAALLVLAVAGGT